MRNIYENLSKNLEKFDKMFEKTGIVYENAMKLSGEIFEHLKKI